MTIQGFQVGTIDQISLLSGNKDIAVRFRVEKEYEFSKNSIAKIYEAGLLAESHWLLIQSLMVLILPNQETLCKVQ